MIIKLSAIAYARSGDKGAHTNVGIVFINKDLYDWAKTYLSTDIIKSHFSDIAKGKVLKYDLDNLNAINYILEDSLRGGGSESLLNDAQGKTYGQALLLLEVELPDALKEYINE
tara:strand:- start:353 stop:694 length:342 start_codon:yes stop_codon:yes gene_type:complete